MKKLGGYESVDYHVLYAELVRAARQRGTVTYQDLAALVGLPSEGTQMGNELGDLVGLISQNEVNHDRPMLSALVVKTTDIPGGGFFKWARDLGLLKSEDRQQERVFWEEQKKKIYEIWQPTVAE